MAIDSETAKRAGYKVGDTVRISVDGPVLTPKITGIFTTDDGNVTAGGSLALFDTATAQKLFGKAGTYDEIDVKAAAGTSQTALKAQLDSALPKGLTETTTAQKLADDQAETIASSMSGLKQGLLVFAGIALFVGTFIIANTFTMLVAQRTKELALLRAVGASRRQVTRSVLLEAFVVGAVAAVAGLVAGIGIGAGLRALMGTIGATVPDGPLVITSNTVLSALAVGILITMLAAWLPGRRAAKIPPVAAMSSLYATATTKSLVLRNTLGALFSGAGIAVVIAATSMNGSDGQAPMGLGAVLLIIGVFILTPLLSRPLIAASAPVLRIFGISGKLARQNSVRNPRRTAATASALMIGLTLITGMTVMAGSLQQAIDKMASSAISADYIVSMANGNSLSRTSTRPSPPPPASPPPARCATPPRASTARPSSSPASTARRSPSSPTSRSTAAPSRSPGPRWSWTTTRPSPVTGRPVRPSPRTTRTARPSSSPSPRSTRATRSSAASCSTTRPSPRTRPTPPTCRSWSRRPTARRVRRRTSWRRPSAPTRP